MTIWHVSITEMKYQTFAMYLISSNEWRIMYWYNLCQLSSKVSILILYATRDSCAVTYPVLSQSQLFFFLFNRFILSYLLFIVYFCSNRKVDLWVCLGQYLWKTCICMACASMMFSSYAKYVLINLLSNSKGNICLSTCMHVCKDFFSDTWSWNQISRCWKGLLCSVISAVWN